MDVYQFGSQQRQHGMTLIEVLIAASILTIGLLGVFQLHILAKRTSFDTYQSIEFSALIVDIIERIRLNPSQLANYAGNYAGTNSITPSTVSCDDERAACNAEQIREWDLYQWQYALLGKAVTLGGNPADNGRAVTGCIYVSGNDLQVVVSWRGLSASVDGASKDDANEQACGAVNDYRRVLSMQTVVRKQG